MKHHITRTVHAAMGKTLQIMSTETSRSNGNYKIWYKGQTILILSRTKLAKNTIFLGWVIIPLL